jgi:hypothetical protein
MSVITREPKTFNNCLGFERGLWQHQMTYFAGVPKMRVFETTAGISFVDLASFRFLRITEPINYR